MLRFYTDRDLLRRRHREPLRLLRTARPPGQAARRARSGRLHTGDMLSMSSGIQLIDLVHVDDIVRALLLAADLCASGPVHPSRRRRRRHLLRGVVRFAAHLAPARRGARRGRRAPGTRRVGRTPRPRGRHARAVGRRPSRARLEPTDHLAEGLRALIQRESSRAASLPLSRRDRRSSGACGSSHFPVTSAPVTG